MSEINIPKENEGFIYTILSFERNETKKRISKKGAVKKE